MSSVKTVLILSLQSLYLLLLFLVLLCLWALFSMMLGRRYKRASLPCSWFSGESIQFFTTGDDGSYWFLQVSSNKLRKLLGIPTLLRVSFFFSHEWRFDFVKCLVCVNWYIWSYDFSCFLCWYSGLHWYIFKCWTWPHVPGISPIWSWCIIVLYIVGFDFLYWVFLCQCSGEVLVCSFPFS